MTLPRTLLVLLPLLSSLPMLASASGLATRTFHLEWTIQVRQLPPDAKEARIWVAVPQQLDEQQVSDLQVATEYEWSFVEDPEFRNKVAMITVQDPAESLSVDLSARVVRDAVDRPRPAHLTDEKRALYLREESLVSLSPRIHQIAEKVGKDHQARYAYVLKAMDYDKTVPGWGMGDSERACDVGKGNCTDFHSLFMSLSRAEGVPAFFEMGFATQPEGEKQRTGGYHCWAWYYDDDQQAWVPVDISEADKHPEKEGFYFGHLDPDRISYSRGREIKLPGMKGKPLNYLPADAYVEVDGEPLGSVSRIISYTVESGARSSGY